MARPASADIIISAMLFKVGCGVYSPFHHLSAVLHFVTVIMLLCGQWTVLLEITFCVAIKFLRFSVFEFLPEHFAPPSFLSTVLHVITKDSFAAWWNLCI